MTTAWKVLRAMSGLESGRSCRRCDEPIPSQDEFGMSEGVCGPCRHPAQLVAVRFPVRPLDRAA